MKSSHRSFDRSNVELGLIKKARLTDESNRNEERLVSQQQQQQQQHDELIIIKYKRALAELTINSKPIITNLTIIAGENLRSAKAITAIICGNILEIPSEQKLPSLYLLDSIVKNIGRDYIKYFSARLPEVFCKAYREVKPLVHPGMRRLFGTWRRVFPPQQLQLIEKELGFTVGINGSSSGTPRDDSQAHQPADSMLVNRKYLDARRYLQQPTRANGSADDIIPTDIEKPDRAASVGSGSSWVDLPTKRVHDNTINAAYRDPEYGSDLSRGSGFGSKIKGEKFKEEGFDKSWYNSVNGKSRRNGLDMKHGFQSISQKTAKSGAYPQLTHSFANRSTLMDRSWQNSEEEEYMWDDVNSVGKDRWAPEDSDKPRLDNQLPRPQSIQEVRWKADSEASSDSLSTEDKGQASTGDQMSSMWLDGATHSSSVRSTPDHPRGYQTSFNGLSTATSSIARKPFQSQKHSIHVGTLSFGSEKTAVESRGPIIQPREAHRAATPSSQSPMHQLPPSPSVSTSNLNQAVNSVTKEYQAQIESHADTRISQFSRGSNLEPHNQFPQESLSTTSQSAHLVNSQIPQTPTDNPSSLMSSLQEEYHVPFPQKIQRESPESSGYAQKAVVTQISGFADPSGTVPSSPPGSESPGQTSMSSLLAAIMKSGVFGSKSSVAKSVNSWDKEALLSQAGAQPPLPSGPPIQWSSGPKIPPVSVANEQFDRNASNPPNYPERNVERPQLLPGPPTLVGNVSLQASDVSNATSNPVTKLLSSLVAKGLITASKELSPTSTPSQTPPQTEVLGPPPASISSTPVVSAPVSLPIPFSSPNDELSLFKPAAKIPDALLQSTEKERKNVAGFEFKPGVIRESNPGVISELLDDVPYQCGICGLRLKHQVRLDRHLEWHTFRYPDGKLLHSKRRWYLNSEEWISGTGSLPSSSILAGPVEGSSKLSECTEMMVPADEGQCICVLCGQLFEDHYDEESGTWMFKGAVYMNNSSSESGTQSPIVHKNCISESSDNLRLTKDIKLELET